MAILIKGMKMPKEIDILFVYPSGKVFVRAGKDLTAEQYEAIEIPPHGRLIDADALEQDAQKRLLMCDKNDNQFQKPYEVMRAIALAPTIIPANKEK